MNSVDALVASPIGALASALEALAPAERRLGIVSVGTDLVSVPRMVRLVADGGTGFLARGWTPNERAEANGDPDRLATRWAAKEAVMKCLSLGISDLDPRDIEISSSESGAPSAVLRGSAAERARFLGISEFRVSASHESGWAAAIAVACAEMESGNLEVSVQRKDGS